mgnify:CR=1 FL=1
MSAALQAGFAVAADHPCLAGHFPSRPIAPAVLLLDLGCAQLRRLRPELGALLQVRSAKFMQPVLPQQAVQALFEAGSQPGLWRMSLSTAAGVAVQAQLVFAA